MHGENQRGAAGAAAISRPPIDLIRARADSDARPPAARGSRNMLLPRRGMLSYTAAHE